MQKPDMTTTPYDAEITDLERQIFASSKRVSAATTEHFTNLWERRKGYLEAMEKSKPLVALAQEYVDYHYSNRARRRSEEELYTTPIRFYQLIRWDLETALAQIGGE